MYKRKEIAEALLSVSNHIDIYTECLRSARKQQRWLKSNGLTCEVTNHSVLKYDKIVRILNIRFDRICFERSKLRYFATLETAMKKHGAIPGDWRHFFEDLNAGK